MLTSKGNRKETYFFLYYNAGVGLKAILQEPSLTNLTVKVTVLDANLSPHFIPGVGPMGTGKCVCVGEGGFSVCPRGI